VPPSAHWSAAAPSLRRRRFSLSVSHHFGTVPSSSQYRGVFLILPRSCRSTRRPSRPHRRPPTPCHLRTTGESPPLSAAALHRRELIQVTLLGRSWAHEACGAILLANRLRQASVMRPSAGACSARGRTPTGRPNRFLGPTRQVASTMAPGHKGSVATVGPGRRPCEVGP
jgi:hypothetical protein